MIGSIILAAVAGSLTVPAPLWARVRVSISYAWRHGYLPNLSAPTRYNELVQWRKLNDRDPDLARLTGKLHAKALATARVDPSLVIPTLWHGDVLPAQAPWPKPFIVKANHGCGQFVVVRNDQDWQRARRIAPRWLARAYGRWLDEWHYGLAQRTLLVEPFIGGGERLPLDYKVFVFGRRAEFVQVHVDREADHRWIQFDRNWRRVSGPSADAIPAPTQLAAMLDAAERIAAGQEHLRVDFYEVDGRLWFGELCLFPGSGLERFDPVALDETFGRLWSNSLAGGGRARAAA